MGQAISLRVQSLGAHPPRSWFRLGRLALLTPSCGGRSADREEKRVTHRSGKSGQEKEQLDLADPNQRGLLAPLGLAGIRSGQLRLEADSSACTFILKKGDAELPKGPLELFGGVQAKAALFSFETRDREWCDTRQLRRVANTEPRSRSSHAELCWSHGFVASRFNNLDPCIDLTSSPM